MGKYLPSLGDSFRLRGRIGRESALPDGANDPTVGSQTPCIACISPNVGGELRQPECPIPLRRRGAGTIGMPVPKAPVNENRYSRLRQHDVGRSLEIAAVQAKADPEETQFVAERQLRRRVTLADGRHSSADLRRHYDGGTGGHSGSAPIRSESPAMPTARANSGGTASPITLANKLRVTGLPGGTNS